MAVTEGRRLALFEAARRSFGEPEAETLMDLVAPAGAQLATREDLAGLESRVVGNLRGFALSLVLTTAMAQTALTVSLVLLLQR
ncbi:MAG: hypothetical protein RLZZ272_681 [Actinomycetota bacterium]